MLTIIIAILFVLAWSVINSILASEKHLHAVGFFFLSIAISPLLVYLYLLATHTRPESEG